MNAVLYTVMALAALPLLAYAVWGYYLAIMNLKRARDAGQLTRVAYCLALPMLGIGYMLDLALQLVATLVFLDPPRELTLTYRLKRYKGRGDYRGKVSAWMAAHLLDPFDPNGRHV